MNTINNIIQILNAAVNPEAIGATRPEGGQDDRMCGRYYVVS